MDKDFEPIKERYLKLYKLMTSGEHNVNDFMVLIQAQQLIESLSYDLPKTEEKYKKWRETGSPW